MRRADVLPMWTLYDHPSDMPDCFVARLWHVGSEGTFEPVKTDTVMTAKFLDDLRDMLPQGLYCIPRLPDDDPCIIETWL